MRILAALVLTLILLFPTPAMAAPNICLKVELVSGEPICVKTGVKPLDEPSIEVPPPRLPDIELPDIRLPRIETPRPNTPRPPTSRPQSPSDGSSGGSRGNVSPRSQEPFLPGYPTQRNSIDDGPQPPNPQEDDTPPPSNPSVEPGIEDNPNTEYKFKDYPWYFWTALAVCAIGLGFMLFYDTDKPKPEKGRHSK